MGPQRPVQIQHQTVDHRQLSAAKRLQELLSRANESAGLCSGVHRRGHMQRGLRRAANDDVRREVLCVWGREREESGRAVRNVRPVAVYERLPVLTVDTRYHY